MASLISLVVCSNALFILISSATTNPTWIENTAIKTGYENLFTTVHGGGTSKSFNINYGNAFSNSVNPYLAYGIQKYRGKYIKIIRN